MDMMRRAEKHPDYVAKGYCPAVHWTKAWCVQPAGHDRDHFAIYLRPDGMIEVGIRWD